jgi:hypothetical protein
MVQEQSAQAMCRPYPGWFGDVDTRLVAAVQSGAGARCHEAANLLQSYLVCAEVYRMRLQRRKEKAQEAWSTLQQAKVKLRKFLCECRACS